MNYREDLRMSVRSVIGRPAESLLLSLGVALAVGSTAAGIALAGRTAEQSRELLSSTRYREVVVAAREDADEMDLPAQIQTSADVIMLTAADLEARSVMQVIQHAYLANQTAFRFDESGFGRSQGQNENQSDQPQIRRTQEQTQGAAQARSQSEQGQGQQAEARTGASQSQNNQNGQGQQGGGFSQNWERVAAPEGPQPQLELVEGFEVSPEFFGAWELVAAAGSLFTSADMEGGEPILVLGSDIGATLFEDGESLGRQVLSRNQLYRITGVLEPSGTEMDERAFTPARIAARQLQGFGSRFRALRTNLRFTVHDPADLDEARAQLVNWFDSLYGVGAVAISIPRDEAEATTDRNSRLATVILFLSLSALLIAAVNVTNIFFSRAVRKRRSVGILKAVGANIRQVFTVFFLEALLIGAVGAGVGFGLSALLSRLMEETIGFGALQIGLIVVGVLASWAIVAVFNVVPSSAAARTPAAEAIRYE